MAILTILPPFYYNIAEAIRLMLEDHRSDIEDTLADQSVPLDGTSGSIDAHLGHWKNWPHFPVIEIVGRSHDRPWLAHSYLRDNVVTLGILCATKNIERADRDRTVSVLGSVVAAILDARDHKSWNFTFTGQTYHTYDMGMGSVSLGTLDQGTTFALEIPLTVKFIHQVQDVG